MKNNILLVFCLFLFYSLSGQSINPDLNLIRRTITDNRQPTHTHTHTHTSSFPFPGTHNPAKLVLGSAMWFYQNLISPQLSASCLYEPTCSGYSVSLIREYGIIRGMVFSADRLTRCNRMAANDFSYTRINPATGHIRETTDYYQIKRND